MATATFTQDGSSINYTPETAVAAGDVVVIGDLLGIARTAIPAGQLGSLAIEGVFRVPKATGASTAIAAGAKVYWDATNEVATETATGNKRLGTVSPEGAGGDTDATIEVFFFQV